MSLKQLIKNIVSAELQSLAEAKANIPPELSSLTARLELKFEQLDSKFIASKKISEKKAQEQKAFDAKWNKMLSVLSKKPWKRVNGEQTGWNAQNDTGGNFSKTSLRFRHLTGLNVSASNHVSFSTGTKSWTLVAWYDEQD